MTCRLGVVAACTNFEAEPLLRADSQESVARSARKVATGLTGRQVVAMEITTAAKLRKHD
jgi:hypothetical protein